MLGTDFTILGIFKPYGICMALGILGCFLYLFFSFKKMNFNDEAIEKLLFMGVVATLFGILMAAIVQGLYNYIAGRGFNLLSMTFTGGLIGGVAGFLILWNIYMFVVMPRANKSKNKMVVAIFGNHMNATLTDALPFVPPAITIAHCLGRLGCFFAGCCHGWTDTPWGLPMYVNGGYFGDGISTPVTTVPTQLFECIFLAGLSAVMILLALHKFKYNFSVYLIAYGIWRFLIEYLRADYRGDFVPGMSPSQFWSLLMIPLAIAYVFLQKYLLAKMMKHPELQPPVRQPKKKKALAEGEAPEAETVLNDETAPVPEKSELPPEVKSDKTSQKDEKDE